MPLLQKSQIPAPPDQQAETVTVPELGGDVIVRGLLLRDRISVTNVPGYGRLAATLAGCVFVLDGEGNQVPLYTSEEWERWGAAHYEAALRLWEVAYRLSGDGDAEKKSDSPSSG